MRIKLIMLLGLMIAVTIGLTGCGDTQQIEEEAVPAASIDDNKEEASSGGNIGNTMNMGDDLAWDKRIPDVFPMNSYGTCVLSQTITEDNAQDVVWHLMYQDMSRDDVDDYMTVLRKEGWTSTESILDTLYHFEKGVSQIVLTFGEEDGETIFAMFLDEDASEEETYDEDGDYDEDEDIEDEIEDLNLSIPDNYPSQEVPLYEKGTLYLAQQITYDDQTAFAVAYMCEGTFKEVAQEIIDTYNKLGYEETAITQLDKMAFIIGTSDNYSYTVTIGDTEGAKYPVDVSYIVEPKE